MLAEYFGGKLVVNYLESVRNDVVLLGEGSERGQDGVVDVLHEKHSVEGIDD